tara:strand:- start:394 stop:906 length:513 start_codon:yes stop_codon:yes gene_type:complete
MASNLQFIKSASGSSVSSLSVTDCFSANYDVYEIVIRNFQSSGNVDGNFRFLNSSNAEITSSDYDFARLNLKSYTSFSDGRQTGQTSLQTGMFTVTSSDGTGEQIITVFNAFDSSSFSFLLIQGAGIRVGSGLDGYKNIGILKSAQQCKGFSILPDSGTISLQVSVYGVK